MLHPMSREAKLVLVSVDHVRKEARRLGSFIHVPLRRQQLVFQSLRLLGGFLVASVISRLPTPATAPRQLRRTPERGRRAAAAGRRDAGFGAPGGILGSRAQ